MRRLWGALFMVTGVALILGAGLLLTKNHLEDRKAQEFVQMVIPEIQQEIRRTSENDHSEVQIAEYTPVEYLKPEDLIMTEKTIDGYTYVGYLSIPDLTLELPVMSCWDYNKLEVSPCRYYGTVRGEDLVIMAHNYSTHFGYIYKLNVGDQVQFIDMDGKTWNYKVVAMDILSAQSVEEMTAGEYDLTLFTCDKNRSYRVTVRCNRIIEE